MIREIIVLVVLILTTACAPMTSSFYRPTAAEGKVVNAFCPPVESVILVEKNEVIVSARASYTAANKIAVIIGFEVPEGKVVILESHDVTSLEDDQLFDSRELVGRIWVSRGRTAKFSISNPMIGKTGKDFYGLKHHMPEIQTILIIGFPLNYPCLDWRPSF